MSSLINTADMVCDCVELSQLNLLLVPFADRVFVRCTSAGNRGTGLVISWWFTSDAVNSFGPKVAHPSTSCRPSSYSEVLKFYQLQEAQTEIDFLETLCLFYFFNWFPLHVQAAW